MCVCVCVCVCINLVGRDSTVVTATCYWLESPGNESRQETRSGAHLGSYTMGIKRPDRGIKHQPPSSTEVKEGVKLYIYSLSGSSRPGLG